MSSLTVPEVVRRSGASTGATYRVLEFLEAEGLLERALRGPIEEVAWRRLLARWSSDYGFQRSNLIVSYLQPRGLSAVLEALRDATDLRYVVLQRPKPCSTGWKPMSAPGGNDLLVAARRALLDALAALGPHLDSVVLIGAQAIYLHTGNARRSGWRSSPRTATLLSILASSHPSLC